MLGSPLWELRQAHQGSLGHSSWARVPRTSTAPSLFIQVVLWAHSLHGKSPVVVRIVWDLRLGQEESEGQLLPLDTGSLGLSAGLPHAAPVGRQVPQLTE